VRLLAVLLLACACRGKPSASAPCDAVATRRYTLAEAALGSATVDPATRHLLDEQLPAMRDALATACRDGAWSPAIRDCMVQAPDPAAFQACELKLTDDQRRALTPSP
jgi:hypothetical protein